jgi:hypothetical protein
MLSDWVSFLVYANLFEIKGFVVVFSKLCNKRTERSKVAKSYKAHDHSLFVRLYTEHVMINSLNTYLNIWKPSIYKLFFFQDFKKI